MEIIFNITSYDTELEKKEIERIRRRFEMCRQYNGNVNRFRQNRELIKMLNTMIDLYLLVQKRQAK